MMKTKLHVLVAIGAILGAVSVAAGAFGTHTLQNLVTADRLATFETATRYLLVHSIVLMFVGFIDSNYHQLNVAIAGWLLLAGMVVFSGSLILLVALELPGLGAVAPVGGVLLISGWLILAIKVLQSRADARPDLPPQIEG